MAEDGFVKFVLIGDGIEKAGFVPGSECSSDLFAGATPQHVAANEEDKGYGVTFKCKEEPAPAPAPAPVVAPEPESFKPECPAQEDKPGKCNPEIPLCADSCRNPINCDPEVGCSARGMCEDSCCPKTRMCWMSRPQESTKTSYVMAAALQKKAQAKNDFDFMRMRAQAQATARE